MTQTGKTSIARMNVRHIPEVPQDLANLIAKVELNIREQEAMLSVLDKKISLPENQMDYENSAKLAAEREEYVHTIDELMEKWESLAREQEESTHE
jgi:ATP-binding cassette subfamily F protein 3